MILLKRILVVEDDIILNSGLCYNLQLDNHEAVPAYNISSAEENIKEGSFDLIVLDVNLPEGSGFDFYRKIKSGGDTPIVFLTARDMEEDVMKGFELGAEDYITKPFNINIFRKKVEAILRRCSKQSTENIYIQGSFIIDFNKFTASLEGKQITLTPTEYKMLKIFTENPNQILTRQVLLEKLWDFHGNFVDEHALTVNINRLRGKIEWKDKKYIKTVYGMGYMWVEEK